MTSEQDLPQPGKPKKPLRYLLIGSIVLALIGVGIYFFIQKSKYETTDNAQLEGNILSIRSGVTAYINEIRFDDNQKVKKGDTLILFNTTVFAARVLQAKAALANASASIKVNASRASSGTQNASASLQMVRSNEQAANAANASLKQAQEEFERTQKLFNIKGVTQQQLVAAQTQLSVARARYQEALSREESSVATARGQNASAQSDQAQVSTAEALVAQRSAELSIAEEELNRAYVLAPCDGTVTKRAVQPGQYVSAGQSLCAVVDEAHLWVSANVKETQLSLIRPGQPVEISVDAYPNLSLQGKVESFGGATGAKFSLMPPDNASGNFVKVVQRVPVRIALNIQGGNSQRLLYPGLSAFVKIKIK